MYKGLKTYIQDFQSYLAKGRVSREQSTGNLLLVIYVHRIQCLNKQKKLVSKQKWAKWVNNKNGLQEISFYNDSRLYRVDNIIT
jgi:hypothetical protein